MPAPSSGANTRRLGSLRMAVDVGGTFTDLIVSDQDGQLRPFKAPSTPSDPSHAVFDALDRAAAAFGVPRRQLLEVCTLFVHGTTVATNTMVQQTGARLGMLTTAGFRDVVAVRRGKRAYMWDYRSAHPRELIPRFMRLAVRERIGAQGQVITPLSEEDVRVACERFRENSVEAVVVGFLNSYLNDDHERRTEALVFEELPDVHVSRSSAVLPVMGEYERYSTTVVNAYVGPRTSQYLTRLHRDLMDAGLRSKFLVMESSGGVVDIETCQRRPVLTVLSGPAAAAPAAQLFGDCLGERDIILFDMGGTSCDVVLVKDGVPAHTHEFQVAGYDIALPAVDVVTIGAGGGTIAWVDSGGLLRVGPHSAGADPGPACYGKGAVEPTVTDANLVLGRLDPENFLGGQMRLDEASARRAIHERVAVPLGLTVPHAALAILRIVNLNMAEAIRMLSFERGHDPRKFVLVSAGGAGGLHAETLARMLGVPEVYLPKHAAVCCTVGMLHSDIRHDFLQSHFAALSEGSLRDAARLLKGMQATAQAWLEAEGFTAEQIEYRPAVGLRYSGQQWQIPIDLAWPLEPNIGTTIIERFHASHERLYGSRELAARVDIMDVRLTAIGPTVKVKLHQDAAIDKASSRTPSSERLVWFEGDTPRLTAIYDGGQLSSGEVIVGPAIIEEPTTTLLVGPEDEVRVDRYGNYRLVRAASARGDRDAIG